MKYYLKLTNADNSIRVVGLLNNCDYSRIEIEDKFIINCFKEHNHKYMFNAFFYNSKRIYSNVYFDSKYKLYIAIQKMLQEELHHV